MINSKDLYFSETRLDDLESILQIEQDNFKTPWSKQQFEKELELLISNCFSLYKNDKLIAYAVIRHIHKEYELLRIAVAKNHQKSGMGSFIMQKLITKAEQNNIAVIMLEVSRNNSAGINLYKKFGFHMDGIRSGYYADEKQDALLMSLQL